MNLDHKDIAKDPKGVAKRVDDLAAATALNGFGAMIQEIPELRKLVLSTAIHNLGAKRKWWDRVGKKWLEEDDGNIQMKAVIWLGSYSDGLPTQTTLNVTRNVDGPAVETDEEIVAAAERSPALRDSLIRVGKMAEKLAIKA